MATSDAMSLQVVGRAALAGGPAVARIQTKLTDRRSSPSDSTVPGDGSIGPISNQTAQLAGSADLHRVLARVREVLLKNITKEMIDPGIAVLLRDTQFAAAWNNATAVLVSAMRMDVLLNPVIDESLRGFLAGYRDELQLTASVWAEVVRKALEVGSPRKDIELKPSQLILPNYLDDDHLPIEVCQVLRSRDIAALSLLALNLGANDSAHPVVLAEYAERHCAHQRLWLDFLSWLFELTTPSIVKAEERQDWANVFSEWREMQGGIAAMVEHAETYHPDGFSIGHTSPTNELKLEV